MEKVLRLYKYIDGINDIAFPNEKEQAIITSFRYDAKRMGAAPTISFSLMHSLCLDSLWDNKVYALFNGERFYVKQTPTSSYSSSDTRYKHEVELVSERFILDNIYFYDVVSSSSQDKPVSNSSKFSFFGNIKEYVSRLNNSLNKSNVGYSIVIDDDILSDEALMSIESQVTFEDQVITNALQEIYNVYKIPYYFVGKTIHVGYYQDNIDTVFKYGCDNSLISISKTNANSKVINKITGVGSSDNIPYYYPNVDEKGITQVLCNGREGKAVIIDLDKYRKVKLADKFVFHETIQSLVPLIDENDYTFGDFRDEGIDGDGKQRVSIDFYYSFTLQQYEIVEFSVTTTYEDSLDLRYEIFNPSGQYVAYYKEDKRLNLIGGNYQFVIRWSFLSKEPMIGSDDVIKNFVSQYLNVKANIVVDSSNAWTKNNIPITLSDYGISVNNPSDGDVLTIERLAYIQPQPNLVPPIYRDTEGGERFYEAINGKYKNEQGGYYQFENEYTPTNPREHIENFDDIKPTIKNVINGSGYYIDEFIDFAYDLDDNDETDESGKFIHPYFFGKLRRFDGEFGFNLFDHAIDEGEMVVSMTSGTCGSCEFVIGVDEQSQKNIVQVDSDGNLVRDNNGNVRRTGTPQDRQNDTKNNEVWIALKKDIQTFGVVMPNVGNNYRPKAGDKFVLLHIDLPKQYVEAAENALKDKLIKYMHENNFEKFNFSIAFSRIYFAENQTILAKLSENSKIQVEYNNNIYDLYISSLSYSISNDSALPEVKVELEDALSISQNQITQVVESTKREIISSIDKNVFWGDIKGVPTWITSDKPRYSYSELSGRGTSDNSNDVWVVKKDAQGNSYVYTKLDVIVERGVTMYSTDGSVNLPSIYDGLPLDNDTIYWEETKDEEGNVIAKVLKSRGVGEGGVTPTMLGDLINVGKWANAIATEDRIMVQKKDSSSWEALELSKIGGSASFDNVKESGEGNAFTSFTLSEDKKTLTFVKDKTFAEKSSTLSGYGITDAYTKHEADNLLSEKWTQDNNKIANWDTAFGWGDHSKANYATKSSTLSGYGITDAYTKTSVDSLLSAKWTKDDAKISNWDAAYSWGNHAQAGYFKSADFTKNKIKATLGISEWALASTKPSYTTKEVAEDTNLYFTNQRAVSALAETLKDYVTLSGTQTIAGEKNFTGGLKVNGQPIVYNSDGYWLLDGDLIVTGGVTMFANENGYTPSTITDAVSVDNITIIRQDGKLMVNPELVFGGGGGEISSVAWGNVLGKPSWITDTKPEYKYSEIKETPNLDEYAKKGTTLSSYGITDAKIADGVITLGSNTITPLTQSFGDARYVTALGTSGNDLTWTKNGAVNKITVPYATKAKELSLWKVLTIKKNQDSGVVYKLIADLSNWRNGYNGQWGLIGVMYGYRGGNMAGTCVQNIVAYCASYSASGGGASYELKTDVTSYVKPYIVSYNGVNYLALRMTGSGSAREHCFLGYIENLLEEFIEVSESSVSIVHENEEMLMSGVRAKSASQLAESRKIWGQDFDGIDDVSGALSGVTSISMSGSINDAITVIGEEDASTIKGSGHKMYFGGTGYANQSYYFRPLYGSSGATTTALYLQNASASSSPTFKTTHALRSDGSASHTGSLSVGGSVTVNGGNLTYNSANKYWKLEGDLLVTGGVTMFGNDSSFSPSTITQAVNVDGTTIINDGKKLMLNPEIQFGGGGVTDYNDLTGKPDLSVYALKTSLSSYQTKITSENKLDYGLISGTPTIPTNTNQLTNGAGFITSSGSITGNAATATTLKTSRTIWGQSFNGSGNVSGNLKLGSSNLLMESDNSYGDSLWAIFAYGPTLQLKYGSIGETASTMAFQISKTNGEMKVFGDIIPSSNSTYNLGSSSNNWKAVFANSVTFGNGVSASIKTKGWYRFATTINAENVAGGSLIFSIRRQYNNYKTESHIIAVSVGYSFVTFTQIAGAPSDALITKVRATNNTNGVIYFDFYYGVDTTNTHNVYVNCIGSASLQTPTSTTQLLSYVTEFDLVNGFKSNAIHFTSLNNLGYLRSKCGKNLLVGGDNLSGGTTYAFARYSYSDAVQVNRTYRLTICGKLGENTSHIYAYWDGGSGNNTYIGGLSKTEERIITVRAKITNKGTNKQLVFYKFGSDNKEEETSYCYIRWAYLEEEFQEDNFRTGTTITTAEKEAYNTWLTEYNKRDTKTFLHKIQRIDVGDNSYWSADKGLVMVGRGYWSANEGMVLSDASAYPIILKRLNSSGGTYIQYFANNQSALSWAAGVDSSHRFSFFYQEKKDDIDTDVRKMWLDNTGSLSSDYWKISNLSTNPYLMLTQGSTWYIQGYQGYLYLGAGSDKSMRIDSSGNVLSVGGITMYSDLRKKTILNHVELSLKEVADAPLIEHYYNSDESKRTHVGSVAQYWAGLNDWFCKEDGEGFLTMEIQNAALASAISVARELTRYESKTDKQIKKLKKRIGELEEEIENLKKV